MLFPIKLVYKGRRFEVLSVSETASDAMLDTITGLMNNGTLELLGTDDTLLTVLRLSDPAAQAADGGTVELNKIGAGVAMAQGTAATGRIVAADGITDILTCDIGTLESNAVIKLDTTAITAGQPVKIHSFTLTMP